MSGFGGNGFVRGATAVAMVCAGLSAATPGWANSPMTAGVVLEKMSPKELFAYVFGVVDGLAYARFRRDTASAGSREQGGMDCIHDWYFSGDASTFGKIEATFRKYPDQYPSTLLAAMIKKECGE